MAKPVRGSPQSGRGVKKAAGPGAAVARKGAAGGRAAVHPHVVVPLHGKDHELDPIRVKVARVRDLFGSSSAMAAWLGVARSQPGRWVEGRERPNPVAERRIKDFEYVWDRACDEMHPADARIWLESPNAFLAGASPLVALQVRGPGGVIAALDAEAGGSYA